MNRVLHIVPNMNVGGLETFIMNVYRNIDRDEIQFDFLEHYMESSYYDDEIIKLGGKIYHFSLRNDNNIFKYIINLNKFFREHKEYKVIHCHMESVGAMVFLIAKFHGVKVRIGHAHTDSVPKGIKGKVKKITSWFFKYTTTVNLACSKEAGNYLFKNKKFKVIPNGIDFELFKFNEDKRKLLRDKYNFSDNNFVIGHVGRMDDAKNQLFLLDVFYEYHKYNSLAKLVLVGDGELRSKIVDKINDLKLNGDVLLLGVRSDVNELLSMFDLFAFPSKFEGLGIVLIEAQLNGLRTIASDVIPRNTNISNYISYLPLDVMGFVNEFKKYNYRDNKIIYKKNKDSFDIRLVVDKIKKIYNKGV